MRTRSLSARRWVLAGLLVIAAVAVPPARGASLRWKFQPGETLHYVMDQSAITSVKGGPQDIKTTTTQTIDMDWTVKEVGADGVASLTQTITRVRTKIESAFATFEYDSQAPKDPEGPVAAGLLPMLKALVGAQFSFRMTPQGELSDVKVPDSLIEALRKAGPAGGAGMFTAEGMKNMVTESSLALPKDDLEAGKSWNRQTKVPMPPIGSMTIDKTYKFQGPDAAAGKDVVRIDLDTKIDVQPAADAKIDVKVKSQEGKGSFYFDNAAGRVSDSKVSEKIEMVFTVQNAEITQGNETTTSMKLGKVDPAGTPRPEEAKSK